MAKETVRTAITDWEWLNKLLSVVQSTSDPTKYGLVICNPDWSPISWGGGWGWAVDSVNWQTGVVVLDASDIGLSNVDNTSDLNKPISTATQTALDNKADIWDIPTLTSELTNDSWFITSSALSTKQDTLVSGTNIKTINGTSILWSGDIVIWWWTYNPVLAQVFM